jgi:hypothetical protein
MTLELTTDAHELREKFEALARDPSYRFRRSRKGNYINPAVQRDWKWFQLGAMGTEAEVLRALGALADAAGQWTSNSEALRTAHFNARVALVNAQGGQQS